MFSSLRKISIAKKLLIPTLLALFVFDTLYTIFWVNRYEQKMIQLFETEVSLTEQFTIPTLASAVWDYEVSTAETALASLTELEFFRFAQVTTSGDVFAQVQNAESSIDAWGDSLAKFDPDGAPHQRIEQDGMVFTRSSLTTADGENVGELLLVFSQTEINQQLNAASLQAVIIGLVAFILIGVLIYKISQGVTRPLSGVISDIGRLREGDTDVEIQCTSRADELGTLGRSIEVFRQNLIEKTRLEEEEQENRIKEQERKERLRNEERARDDEEQHKRELAIRKEREEDRRQLALKAHADAERAKSHAAQTLVVSELAAGLKLLSEGVLTHRITTKFEDGYEQLRADFNEAMIQLEDVVAAILCNSKDVSDTSGEIGKAIELLAARTETQAHTVGDTAKSVERISDSAKFTSDTTARVSEIMTRAHERGLQNGSLTAEVTCAMQEIEQSAGGISSITNVIDDIAFQTNLLSLNAGVEAARAGDAGLGFAVVATEVRALSQRSSEAAKEIRTLISNSSKQVSLGVDLVDKTSTALKEMVEFVKEANSMVHDIRESINTNTNDIEKATLSVSNLNGVTAQNAAMAEETTAASHLLTKEAETLNEFVARFEVGRVVAEEQDAA